MSDLILEGRNLSFSYDRPVLQDVSLRLHCGEVLGVVGPNGAGKTTLLQILYGRLRPQRGGLLLFGNEPLSRWRPRELAKLIAIVRQETTIGLPITVADFVMQGRYPYLTGFGFESARDVRLVAEALHQTALTHLAGQDAHAISGGERQRMLLARALVQEPRILLLDEPTANLDIKYQLEALRLIKRLTRMFNVGTLIVTHDLNLIAEFADRMIFLKEGRVLCCGAPAEVVTPENILRVFSVDILVDRNPATGRPRISHK